jgi:hypothetical protein
MLAAAVLVKMANLVEVELLAVQVVGETVVQPLLLLKTEPTTLEAEAAVEDKPQLTQVMAVQVS